MPAKKPMSQLFQSSGNSYGADKDSSWAKPATTKRPTTTRRPTTTKAAKKPFKPAAPSSGDQSSLAAQWYGSKPTQEPKPFFAETPGTCKDNSFFITKQVVLKLEQNIWILF